jgi:hypothetical protein
MSCPLKVDRKQIERMVHGKWFVLDWDEHGLLETRKAFQQAFEDLGGFQIRLHKLAAVAEAGPRQRQKREEVILTPEEIDRAYDHIRDKAPKDSDDNAVNRWIKKEKANDTSPIFHLTKQEITDAIRSNKNQGDHASTQRDFPLTLLDVAPWLRPHLQKILKMLRLYSLVMIGEKKKGKTTIACMIAMAISRMITEETGKGGQPGFRLTEDLDFLKDHEGDVEIPIVYDDGDLWELTVKALKALLDVKAREAKTRCRWTSTKLKGGQCRTVCDNPYDETVKITKDMKTEHFMELIAPSFPKAAGKGNLEAFMERSVFMVNTKTHLVIRFPFEDTVVVVEWPTGGMYLPLPPWATGSLQLWIRCNFE